MNNANGRINFLSEFVGNVLGRRCGTAAELMPLGLKVEGSSPNRMQSFFSSLIERS